jgi:hypothetical protein
MPEHFSAQDMIDFAEWFSDMYGDRNTTPTLDDLKVWLNFGN